MKRPSKEDLLKKWTSILGPIGITGSQLENTDPSEFPSLLPTAMKVSAKTLALDLCFASEEEINEVKSRVQSENRDGKIDAVIEGGEFTEKKLEDDPDYKKLMKKGVTPLPAPTGQIFYLDYKYGHKKTRRAGKKHKKKSNE